MKPREQADELLEELWLLRLELSDFEAQAEAELRAVQERYAADIDRYRSEIAARDKELKAIMKDHDPEIFHGADKVTLPHGLLLRSEGYKVRIPRDALPKIEAKGWHEAIRVVKSINRDVVSKWPESRLAVIGAKRRKTVSYEYELKSATKSR